MCRAFSSETALELRLILKTSWSAALRDALIAATTEYRRAARRRPTQAHAALREQFRGDLSKLDTSLSDVQAALSAAGPALRQEILVATSPWLRCSFGRWMTGFAALGRYSQSVRSTIQGSAGRRVDAPARRLAFRLERVFRDHGIPVTNSRLYPHTLRVLLDNAGLHLKDVSHLLPAKRRRQHRVTNSSCRARSPLLPTVSGWRRTRHRTLPSPRRDLQVALGEAGQFPRAIHLQLLGELTRSVSRFQREQHPDAKLRGGGLTAADREVLQRIVSSADRLARRLSHLEHEYGPLDHYPWEWVDLTAYEVTLDTWLEGLFVVATECDTLRRDFETPRPHRPRATARDALALQLAEILTRHGFELTPSHTANPSSGLLLRCLDLAGAPASPDPYRLLRRLSDQLPTYAAERRRERT